MAVFVMLAFAAAGCGHEGSGSLSSGQCGGLTHLADAAQKFSTFLTAKNPDPNTFIKEFHDFSAFTYLDLVSEVPIEIRADARVLDDAFVKYTDVIADLQLPKKFDQKTVEKWSHPPTGANAHKVMQASKHISAWVQRMKKKNC
jgi:hypothetical protein